MTSNSAQITEVLSAYETALNTADAPGAASLYAASGMFFPHNGPTATGADIVGAYRDIFDTIKLEVAFTIHEVVIDGDLAFATTGSKGQVRVLEAGITVPEENRELFVFVREAGAWKIARYMFNKTTAA